jgi:hypothetical protein
MHPTNLPPRAGIAPAAIDVVIAGGHRRGIAAVVEAIGLVALLPLGVAVAALVAAAIVWLFGS